MQFLVKLRNNVSKKKHPREIRKFNTIVKTIFNLLFNLNVNLRMNVKTIEYNISMIKQDKKEILKNV